MDGGNEPWTEEETGKRISTADATDADVTSDEAMVRKWVEDRGRRRHSHDTKNAPQKLDTEAIRNPQGYGTTKLAPKHRKQLS